MKNKKIKWYVVFLITACTIIVFFVGFVYYNDSEKIEDETFERLKTIATEEYMMTNKNDIKYEENVRNQENMEQVKEENGNYHFNLQKLLILNNDLKRMDKNKRNAN